MSYGIKGAGPGYGQGIRGNLGFLLIASIIRQDKGGKNGKDGNSNNQLNKRKSQCFNPLNQLGQFTNPERIIVLIIITYFS